MSISVPLQQIRMDQLPEDWGAVSFSEAVTIPEGQVDPRQEPYASMIHVGPENIERETGRLLPCKTAQDLGLISGKYYFQPGDILYSKIRPYLRKAVYVDFSGVCSADMYPLTPREAFEPQYLYYFILTDAFTQQTVSQQDRTGIPKVNRAQLGQILVPKPPLAEQRAIAKLLSALQTKVDVQTKIVTVLKELKVAATDKLFREGLRGEARRQTEIGELPASWKIVPLGEVTVASAFGPRFSAERYSPDGAVATLRTTDIDEDGWIDYSAMPKAVLDPGRFGDHLLRDGDLVITRSGTCGIAGVFEPQPMPVLPGAFLIRVRLSSEVLPHFMRLWINSSLGRPLMQQLAAGAVQKNISGSSLARLLVPLATTDEQAQIVERLVCLEQTLFLAKKRGKNLGALFASMLRLLMTGQVRVSAGTHVGWARTAGDQADQDGGETLAPGRSPEGVERFAAALIRRFEPERVILFGSSVPGSPKAKAEVGLLVVIPFEGRSLAQAIRIERELKPEFPLELVVRRPQEVAQPRQSGDSFIKGILEKGRVLHARPGQGAHAGGTRGRSRGDEGVVRRGAPSEETIQMIVRRIVEAVDPEKIILFGSAARGELGPNSDLDFLVVKSCANRRETATAIYRNLRGIRVPIDIVVVTPEDVERHKDTIGYILRPALREGRVLYAA